MHARNELQGTRYTALLDASKCYRRIFIATLERYDHVVFAKLTMGIYVVQVHSIQEREHLTAGSTAKKTNTPSFAAAHCCLIDRAWAERSTCVSPRGLFPFISRCWVKYSAKGFAR